MGSVLKVSIRHYINEEYTSEEDTGCMQGSCPDRQIGDMDDMSIMLSLTV